MGKLEKKVLKKVSRISDLCLEISNHDEEEGKPDTFYCYFGNAHYLEVRVYADGWREGIEPDKQLDECIDFKHAEEKLDEMIAYLEDLKEKSERRSDNCELY